VKRQELAAAALMIAGILSMLLGILGEVAHFFKAAVEADPHLTDRGLLMLILGIVYAPRD
jgi:hypothetical protein